MKKKKKKDECPYNFVGKRTCNKCNSELSHSALQTVPSEDDVPIYICINKDCQNYGLLQIPKEYMW